MAERQRHPNFIKYVEFITSHINYKGLFFDNNKDGKIRWVVAGKSPDGQKRRARRDLKCKECNITIEPGCYAKIAVIVHPTKQHTCQICGKSLSVEYVYPNKNFLRKINTVFESDFEMYTKTIFEIIDNVCIDNDKLSQFHGLFGLGFSGETIEEFKKIVYQQFTKKSDKRFLSPGVMSNSPDRYDGFHSDGNCCRSESDKGRHKENLSRYTDDRRVYENRADGDWKKANRLMAYFSDYGLSADHIGPISLGFCHRPKFHPLTKEANSSKNNRMMLSDVKTLINDEKQGDTVISRHSKYIWDILKNKVDSDKDAIKISNIMRVNIHYVLTLFSIISENGFNDFLLQFLNPQYSFFDYRFEDFDPQTGAYSNVIKTEKPGKNQKNNADRYIRIAFESLEAYKDKDNRKTKKWNDDKVDLMVNELLDLLKKNKNIEAREYLDSILFVLAEKLSLLRDAS